MLRSTANSIVLFVALMVSARVSAGELTKEEMRAAFDRGVEYLMTTEDPFRSGASLLAERIGVECGIEKLGRQARNKHEESLQHNEILRERHKEADSDENGLAQTDVQKINRMGPGTEKVIMKSAYCENFSFDDFMNDVQQVGRDGSYQTTHILMGLVQAKNKGCYGDQAGPVDQMISDLADELKAAQELDTQIEQACSAPAVDIYSQRAHVIGDAGYPVSERWLKNIMNCQQPDGGWFTPHATGLSLIALANAMDDC